MSAHVSATAPAVTINRADAIGIAVCAALAAVYAFQRFERWCECAPKDVATAAANLMQSWRQYDATTRAEVADWVRANRRSLKRAIGASVDTWLFCVDAEYDRPMNTKQAVAFRVLIARAVAEASTAADIDRLWAVYFVTGDPVVVDLVRAQVGSCPEVAEKVEWSLRSTGLTQT